MMAISSHTGNGCAAIVPHMVWVAYCGHHDLRGYYGIPDEAIVYGWIGGDAPWDPVVTELVKEVAFDMGAKVFFLFQDFPLDQSSLLQNMFNVLLVEGTNNPYARCNFVRTLDVLLNPSTTNGELGRAVAEVRFCYLSQLLVWQQCTQFITYVIFAAGELTSAACLDSGRFRRASKTSESLSQHVHLRGV